MVKCLSFRNFDMAVFELLDKLCSRLFHYKIKLFNCSPPIPSLTTRNSYDRANYNAAMAPVLQPDPLPSLSQDSKFSRAPFPTLRSNFQPPSPTIQMQPRISAFTAALKASGLWSQGGRVAARTRISQFVCRSCQQKFSTSPSLRLFGKASNSGAKEAAKERSTCSLEHVMKRGH